MGHTVEKETERLARIRRFLGGLLILYVFALMGLWFLEAYLILERLAPLSYLLMGTASAIFIFLFLLFREIKKKMVQ